MLGSYDMDDVRFGRWCVNHRVVGVSVDYRPQAGVPTEPHVYPGAPHAFQLVRDATASQRAVRIQDEWPRGQLR